MTQTQFGSTVVVFAALLAGSAITNGAQCHEPQSVDQQVSQRGGTGSARTEMAGRTQIVSREITGSFAQHPAVLSELRRFLSDAKVPAIGPVMGVYPMDPDAVPEGELRWQVAVPVSGTVRLRSPYSLAALPAGEVALLDTTVGDSHHDGLFMKKRVVDNGFVQVAPTRMLFHELDNTNPLAARTTIVFPVKRRQVMADLLKRPGQ
jgi:hypothetical protein